VKQSSCKVAVARRCLILCWITDSATFIDEKFH